MWLRKLRKLVDENARSPGWNLTPIVEGAIEQNHPDSAWLPKLAAVITEGVDVATLEDWKDWRDVRNESN